MQPSIPTRAEHSGVGKQQCEAAAVAPAVGQRERDGDTGLRVGPVPRAQWEPGSGVVSVRALCAGRLRRASQSGRRVSRVLNEKGPGI